jgi:endo-beta-N-acetylglucosaminidase D
LVESAGEQAKLLYTLQYEQEETPSSPLDLSFDDQILEHVEIQWQEVLGEQAVAGQFMQFEERKGMEADDEDDNDY